MDNSGHRELYYSALVNRAKLFTLLGNFKGAMEEFQSIKVKFASNERKKISIRTRICNLYYKLGKYDKGLEVAKKNLTSATLKKYLNEYFDNLMVMASLNSGKGNILKSIEIEEELAELIRQFPDKLKSNKNSLMLRYAISYGRMGKFEKAKNILEKEISIKNFELLNKSAYYSTLANIYTHLNENDNAELLYIKSQRIKKKIGDINGLNTLYYNLSRLYVLTNRDRDGEILIKKSIGISKKIGDRWGLLYGFFALGMILKHRGHLSRVLFHFENALKIGKGVNDQLMILALHINISEMFVKLMELKKAKQALSNAKHLRDIVKNPTFDLSYYQGFSEYYYAVGDFSNAREALAKYNAITSKNNDPSALLFSKIHLCKIEIAQNLKSKVRIKQEIEKIEGEIENNNIKFILLKIIFFIKYGEYSNALILANNAIKAIKKDDAYEYYGEANYLLALTLKQLGKPYKKYLNEAKKYEIEKIAYFEMN
ncbi:tetratricopeptide repeat protein [bacterium]|nr:tetratricopeptide repeat protein [bacterium]